MPPLSPVPLYLEHALIICVWFLNLYSAPFSNLALFTSVLCTFLLKLVTPYVQPIWYCIHLHVLSVLTDFFWGEGRVVVALDNVM